MFTMSNSSEGFTLIELLVTIIVFSITVSIAAPTLTAIVSSNQLSTTTSLIERTVAVTRMEAITRGHRVIMCLTDSYNECDSSAPEQILVFSDADRTGAPSNDRDVIRIVQLDYPTVTASYNRSYLAFSAIGYASGTNGTFTTCHNNGNGEMLIISTLGRTRRAVDYDGDGLVEKVPGAPISC